MEYTVSQEKNSFIIRPIGRLDSTTSPDFEQCLAEYLKSPGGHLLLDFEELDYISSAGLRVVLNAAKVYREVKWTFAACCMQDHVREVFEISGFDSFVSIYDTVAGFIDQVDG